MSFVNRKLIRAKAEEEKSRNSNPSLLLRIPITVSLITVWLKAVSLADGHPPIYDLLREAINSLAIILNLKKVVEDKGLRRLYRRYIGFFEIHSRLLRFYSKPEMSLASASLTHTVISLEV
jgi:hypothetical protein